MNDIFLVFIELGLIIVGTALFARLASNWGFSAIPLCLLSLMILICRPSLAKDGLIRGADVSFLEQVEQCGGKYFENGEAQDLFLILKEHGINYIRLRIWNSPTAGVNDLSSTIRVAKRIKGAGMKFLLDFHYSDSWADPSLQRKPAAWKDLSFKSLNDSLYAFTGNVLRALRAEGVMPEMVQIGNEVSNGMLWNDGRIGGVWDGENQWSQFTDLLKSGIRALHDNSQAEDSLKIIIHIDRSGDYEGSKWFYDQLVRRGIYFDIIGLSYYPWWHGDMEKLKSNLDSLSERYGKGIIIAETAYPWTLGYRDSMTNVLGPSGRLLNRYSATVEGQGSFLRDQINIIKNVKGNKWLGLFYWEPEYISVWPLLSSWENLCLFDFNGELLNSMDAFLDQDKPDPVKDPKDPGSLELSLEQNYPNPFNPETRIRYRLKKGERLSLKIYDTLGREIETVLNQFQAEGEHVFNFNAEKMASGVYLYRVSAGGCSLSKKMIYMK